jgi:hypothetical protein
MRDVTSDSPTISYKVNRNSTLARGITHLTSCNFGSLKYKGSGIRDKGRRTWEHREYF